MKNIYDQKIVVIGLGYVGLPLALALSKKFEIIGYDINKDRVLNLKKGIDTNKEFSKKKFIYKKKILFTLNTTDIKNKDIYIITAPTPLTNKNTPDLGPLKKASILVGRSLKKNSVIIYESTVYPGTTEEICIPILEKFSNLKFNKDFYCGYSPERINPGDKVNKLENIKKVISASNKKTLLKIKKIYSSIIKAGVYMANSIKIAEAAKVIENTQRDLNIAYVNELSFLFHKLKIDTQEVLKAAATKWNFLNFKPGLVGGHCVSIDPYYLTFKAKKVGYNPKIILSGRKVNNSVAKFISDNTLEFLKRKNINLKNAKILIAGFAFKNDCTDSRNTKVYDIFKNLKKKVKTVDVFDPVVNSKDVYRNYKIILKQKPKKSFYDGIILAVDHKFFIKKNVSFFKNFLKKKSFFYDVKSIYKKNLSDIRL